MAYSSFREPRGRFLIVLDADSTLIENESIELLAQEAGSLEKVAAITESAMRGERDFRNSLRERVATLRGLDDGVFARVAATIRVTEGAQQLITTVQAAGGVVGVVSGGFHELLDPIAEKLGLNFCYANRLDVSNKVLTGTVNGPIVDADAKADALQKWASKSGIPLYRTIAVGDGANDLVMMRAAGLSVAFNAKPTVYRQAHVCIDRRDLSQVVSLIGLSISTSAVSAPYPIHHQRE